MVLALTFLKLLRSHGSPLPVPTEREREFGNEVVSEVVTHLIWKIQRVRGRPGTSRAYVTSSDRRGIYVGCA